ncbi:hypothetical protein [Vibrio rumoiensis]|uniref:Nitrate/nitrite sensing protein domain-containing protein n=1 Tax=Vibrio rumoiensis 1S-45 TaxID=1188252 RepID=A0A1E5E3M8_9VIBR|nr:hypothetical protein [Vibrio rumoiensis]OEF26946.1 hypothetical protein A1QC_00845 [Vibrio rumoiensis 1S-45]
MFISVSLFIVAAIVACLIYFSGMREKNNHSRHALINQLRALIFLVRQHRATTHSHLSEMQNNTASLESITAQMTETFTQLKVVSAPDTKLEIRILHEKTQILLDHWSTYSIAKNQLEHGRVIRQILFLIDEVLISWLVDSHHDDIASDYHHGWQKVLDTLEVLTRFRISIQEIDSDLGKQRFRHHASVLSRRLNQLSLICPLTTADSDQNGVIQTLKQWQDSEIIEKSPLELYQLSLDASLIIFNIYDQILSDICESIYLPLENLDAIEKKPAQ